MWFLSGSDGRCTRLSAGSVPYFFCSDVYLARWVVICCGSLKVSEPIENWDS